MLEEAIHIGRFDVAQSETLLLQVLEKPPHLPSTSLTSGFRQPLAFMLTGDEILDLMLIAPRCYWRRRIQAPDGP